MAIRERRNIELSTLEFFTSNIASNWAGITVVKAFQDAYKAELPVVAIRLEDPESRNLQIGDNTLWSEYNIVFDIFATSDGQRLDLSQYLIDTIKDGWVYKTYTSSSGTLTGTIAGRINKRVFIEDNRVEFGEDVDRYDKFRWRISVKIKMELT